MGQGTITGGGTDGLYTLTQDFGEVRRDSIKAAYEARIAALNAQLPELEEKRGEADAEIAAASAAEDTATRLYIEALLVQASDTFLQRMRSDLVKARRRVLLAEAEKQSIETPIELVKADIKSLQLQIAELMAGAINRTQPAWCVDLTEDGSGFVGTIEVPGEPAKVLICPGCRPPVHSDGALLARQAMTPAQAFFNAAILPGWQKFKPTYRIGTITAVHSATDTADVTLDDTTSSAQSLDVNQASTLTDVPVEYMTCNSGAFEVGDRVVIQFTGQDWTQPKVIGFESNPKPCNWPCVYATPFWYAHFFECMDDAIWSDIYTSSGISVQFRLDRGAWNTLVFDRTLTFTGGRPPLYIYENPAPPGEILTADPWMELGPLRLSGSGPWESPSVQKINGLTLRPGPSFTGTAPTIAEVLITKGSEILFNGAFRWDPMNDLPGSTEVKAMGGIFIKAAGGIGVEPLEGYDLFVKTGD